MSSPAGIAPAAWTWSRQLGVDRRLLRLGHHRPVEERHADDQVHPGQHGPAPSRCSRRSPWTPPARSGRSAGTATTTPGRPVSSLVVHFNGTSWTRQATPNPANRNTLMDVVALANGEVFAVGVAQDTSAGASPRSLMLRRTRTWSSPTVPKGETGSQDQLLSVAAVSSTSVRRSATAHHPVPYEPLLVHWTGNGGAGELAVLHPSPALTVSALASGVSATSAATRGRPATRHHHRAATPR